MTTARAIQNAITHVAVGLSAGALIESVLPAKEDGACLKQQIFEAVVQVGLNGAALAALGAFLQRDDPTYGIPFSMALWQAQPELKARIRLLSDAVKAAALATVQRTTQYTPMA